MFLINDKTCVSISLMSINFPNLNYESRFQVGASRFQQKEDMYIYFMTL
jgi:hypothetical protein